MYSFYVTHCFQLKDELQPAVLPLSQTQLLHQSQQIYLLCYASDFQVWIGSDVSQAKLEGLFDNSLQLTNSTVSCEHLEIYLFIQQAINFIPYFLLKNIVLRFVPRWQEKIGNLLGLSECPAIIGHWLKNSSSSGSRFYRGLVLDSCDTLPSYTEYLLQCQSSR
jgi:hypothetical protein